MKIKRILAFLLFFVIAMAMFVTFAFGYIDPAATTYIISAISIAVVSIGTGFGVFWYKLKKKLRGKKGEKKGPAPTEKSASADDEDDEDTFDEDDE